MKNALLLAALVSSAPSLAERIAIAPFPGPGGAAARNQLASALCETHECVNAGKVTTRGKPDFKKAQREKVKFFVTGTGAKRGKKLALTLQVLDKPGSPRLAKQYPVEKTGLSPKSLAAAVEAVNGLIGVAVPAEEAPPPVEAKPPPPVETSPAPAEARPFPPRDPPREPEPPVEVVEEAPRPRPRATAKFLMVDIGSDMFNRRFDYVEPTTTNLRRYELTFFPLPRVGIELYPLVLAGMTGVASGFGLEAGFAFMPLLKTSRPPPDTSTFPTSTMRVDAGLKWRLRFSKDIPLALVPFGGIRLHSFTVGPNSTNGARLDGVPNLNYVGTRVGLGLEVPLADDAFTIFAHGAAIIVFSSGEIISQSFFLAGSTLGLEGTVGFGVRVLPFMQVRASFVYNQYSISFRSGANDTYSARGAVDRYLGGNVGLRLQF